MESPGCIFQHKSKRFVFPARAQGQFSPEGTLNAMVILGGIFAPAYSLWKRKTGVLKEHSLKEHSLKKN
jgi:hypothetical protein